MVINNPSQWQMHWDYTRAGLGFTYPRYSPLHWRGRWDYAPHGLGMIHPFNQNWQTSRLPFSLALKNTVSTGVSFDTPSGAIAESQRWARRGMQGYGPMIQYPGGAGMDGFGNDCGCGCGGAGSCGHHHGGGIMSLACIAALGLSAYWLGTRGGNGL